MGAEDLEDPPEWLRRSGGHARIRLRAGQFGAVAFAAELLLADVSMEDVSALLGHRSVQTTEKYYAPWDGSRRDRLTQVVRDAHRRDPLLGELYPDSVQATGGGCWSSPRPRLGQSIQIAPERAWQ